MESKDVHSQAYSTARGDPVILDLLWHPERVKAVFADHGITNRSELADHLSQYGIGRNTVYRVFDENWAGKASYTALAVLHHIFKAPLSCVVAEPGQESQ